ncbi:MAG: hypothetical protein A2W22_06410 [Candidatus Levybacteria bacterium RBG_16_35_11]|nr:MAG: hypothetical protein A2W22_06410 [Candidatus Levybacteria bacterium RBG_16_35_11]
MKKIKTIVICSSGSFYKQLFPIQTSLKKLGYKVVLPVTAHKMKRTNNFDIKTYKTWYKKPQDYSKKRAYMDKHFKKIIKGDAILVANFDKKRIKGYIGGNTLMEITIAYFHKKPIFILNDISSKSLIKEEIYGVNPVFLKGSLNYFTL